MTKYERNIIYSLPIVSICFEIVKSFIGSGTQIMAVRNYLVFVIILFFVIKYFKQGIQLNVYLIIITLYFLIELIVQNAGLKEYNELIQFFDAKMLILVGFAITTSYDHFEELNKKLLITNILFTGSIIVFASLGIGKDQYGAESGFRTGAFTFSAIYIGSFLLLTYPVQFKDLKSKLAKAGLILLGVVTFIVLVLSVRRSAIVIVLIGAMVFVYIYRAHIRRIVLNAIGILFLLIVSYPLYEKPLNKQLATRSDVFNDKGVTQNLQEETRLEESIAVYEERIKNPNPAIFFFGDHLFDSSGNYDGGIHGIRPLHLDTNIVLHGSGMVGLLLFIFIYIRLFHKFVVTKTRLSIPNEHNLAGVFFSMFLSHLFLIISGGMVTITFNMISSLYMGGILGLYRSAHKEAKLSIPTAPSLMPSNAKLERKAKKPKPFIYEVRE